MGEQRKMSKEKKKCVANLSEELSDYGGAAFNEGNGGCKPRKENKRKKRDEREGEVSIGLGLDDTCDEHINVESFAEVDEYHPKEERKKKKKKKKRKLDIVDNNAQLDNETDMGGEERRILEKDNNEVLMSGDDIKATKKKKNRLKADRAKDNKYTSSSMRVPNEKDAEKVGEVKEQKTAGAEKLGKMGDDVEVSDTAKKKTSRKKRKNRDDVGEGMQQVMAEELGNHNLAIEGGKLNTLTTRGKIQDAKMKKSSRANMKKSKSVETILEDPKPKRRSKKVSFSGHIEVFPLSDDPNEGMEKNQEEELVQGKRFSPEEDALVKDAVFNYIRVHGLGKEGLNMVMNCKAHPELKGCWKEIGAVLPHRPYTAIYYRAHTLFERAESRSWTAEELEIIKEYYDKHGPKWKKLAGVLGKHRVHLKDAWRRIKLPNANRGRWSQDEYQNLFDLVNLDLRMKVFEERKSKYGMLRDNISWSAVSDKLSTRTVAVCCMKWYKQLTSPMVAEGKWADTDDYRLLHALYSLDACCIEDVDWDNLLDHRSGDVCLKRWNQMIRHIGEYGNKSFAEQVEILSERYCPDELEAREAWDRKPVVP
ncbi:RNA polymerase I termination factor [Diospyros lotus]|uniref:RNA polymerase I termination factor n=1 Tax=Diospyros lotus TaxID=55363 RepID=UPI0022586A9C|nr:RNA polymerase I termination factor [Diospyros lotus]